jgi:hypothetical protein
VNSPAFGSAGVGDAAAFVAWVDGPDAAELGDEADEHAVTSSGTATVAAVAAAFTMRRIGVLLWGQLSLVKDGLVAMCV